MIKKSLKPRLSEAEVVVFILYLHELNYSVAVCYNAVVISITVFPTTESIYEARVNFVLFVVKRAK